MSLARDASGNIYVTGSFTDAVNFGGMALTSAGDLDIFLASFRADGTHRWSQRFGGAAPDRGYGVAVDGSGNVTFVGGFTGVSRFGGTVLTSAGSADIVVASFTSEGTPRWARRFGSTAEDLAFSVTTDTTGNVYVTGVIGGQVDFGGGITGRAGADVFLLSCDTMGTYRWARAIASSNSSFGLGVASNGRGAIVVVGFTEGTVDFGGGGLPSVGTRDAFVASYSDTNAYQWARRFSGGGTDALYGVAFDRDSNVVVVGSFQGTVDFGRGALTSVGARDIIVASYTPTGAPRWSQRYGDAAEQRAFGVAVDGEGNAYVTGSSGGSVDFGGGALASAGDLDGYLFSVSATGTHRWSRRFGGTGADEGDALVLDPSGALFVTGFATGTIDFGRSTPVVAEGIDVFVARFEQRAP